jgi:superfamily II DNA or RNA helicase/phage anti-repressor protein
MEEYDNTKTIMQNIGTSYEYFVLEKLKSNYDNVWHWKDFPEELLYKLKIIDDYEIYSKYRNDLGADLVALKDDKYYFIQCKNYSETINIKDLGGFYFFVHEYGLNGVICYNGTISKRYTDLSKGKVEVMNIPFNTENVHIQRSLDTKKFAIRKYQQEAYEELKNAKTALLDMPCGTGKLYVAGTLAKKYKNVIIFSPLRMLAAQALVRLKCIMGSDYEYILVSSDGLRDTTKIKQLLGKKNVLSATYDSADVILKLMNSLSNIYIIIDEFHNLSNTNLYIISNPMCKILKKDNDRLYMSATPIEDVVCKKKYKYDWATAIKDGYICDFKIVIPEITNLDKFKEFIEEINNENDTNLYCKAYFILRSMLFNGNKKCIVFLTSIEMAFKFQHCLEGLSKLMNINSDMWQLNCNTSRTKRDTIYEEFRKSVDVAFILNVQILNEGIDIVECDSVFITNPSNDMNNLVQRMCRANRIGVNKKICYAYLWCTQRKVNKLLTHIFDKTDNYCKDKVYKFSFLKNDAKFIPKTKKIVMKCVDKSNNMNKNDVECYNNDLYKFMIKNRDEIPEEFISSFRTLLNSDDNSFVIDFDLVTEWIGTRKGTLKEVLVKKFEKDCDYSSKQLTKSTGGKTNNYVEIKITSKCFKQLCMMSQTEKAKQIKKYLLGIEKIIKIYYETTQEKLNNEMKLFKN